MLIISFFFFFFDKIIISYLAIGPPDCLSETKNDLHLFRLGYKTIYRLDKTDELKTFCESLYGI